MTSSQPAEIHSSRVELIFSVSTHVHLCSCPCAMGPHPRRRFLTKEDGRENCRLPGRRSTNRGTHHSSRTVVGRRIRIAEPSGIFIAMLADGLEMLHQCDTAVRKAQIFADLARVNLAHGARGYRNDELRRMLADAQLHLERLRTCIEGDIRAGAA